MSQNMTYEQAMRAAIRDLADVQVFEDLPLLEPWEKPVGPKPMLTPHRFFVAPQAVGKFKRGQLVAAKTQGHWYPAKIIRLSHHGYAVVEFLQDAVVRKVYLSRLHENPLHGTPRGEQRAWQNGHMQTPDNVVYLL